MEIKEIKLTQYSHGAGCGCKISPKVLDNILYTEMTIPEDAKLLVGNHSRDDAAVYDIGDGKAIISTTDFFMPIVDDAFDFGRIAAANAISDIYAMGGTPLMAIAILGWPINKLPAVSARRVLEGGRSICTEAGISLGGGHSIDSPEPIFGLAVTGMVTHKQLKQNDRAEARCQLFLTKPIGVGILSTAQKKNKLKEEHKNIARDTMVRLNNIGTDLSQLTGVKAITDVTGFGLLGHLSEMCSGSGLRADIISENVPLLPHIDYYIKQDCIPGGTNRNWDSYGHKIGDLSDYDRKILCDPQTSGGLLIAVEDDTVNQVISLMQKYNLPESVMQPIGSLHNTDEQNSPVITVR
ncbi:MAG TPA: selenide, water dikinase SelD [Balneolales bacterium]|nr:selenide, water dikinase SelD [Balneolales bacterium]